MASFNMSERLPASVIARTATPFRVINVAAARQLPGGDPLLVQHQPAAADIKRNRDGDRRLQQSSSCQRQTGTGARTIRRVSMAIAPGDGDTISGHLPEAMIDWGGFVGFIQGATQVSDQAQHPEVAQLRKQLADQGHQIDVLQRQVDEVLFGQRLGDIAHVDHVRYTGPNKAVEPNPSAQGAGNPLVISAQVYVPKDLESGRKHPLVLFPHGGVHSHHGASAINVVRELVTQGYTVVAPDYRGSTGYGRPFWEAIDYGGREVDDVHAAREWALEAFDHLDPERVGILGWSHGGLITLFNLFDHPDDFAAAYAAVPVSDLIARMGYKSQAYRDLFSAPYHLGKTAEEDVAEYRKRSPSWQTHRYSGTPLLIHTNTNDEDVNVLEVERLIQAFRAGGHDVASKIYQEAPGGHAFNRLDTRLARESRQEAWRFLAPFLKPQRPVE